MSIRLLTPADAAAFQALRQRGLVEVPTAFYASPEEEAGLALDEIARRLQAGPDGAMFGAEHAGRLVGLLGVRREGLLKLRHKAFVWGMYVAPEGRGLGLGRALVQQALAYAWQTLGVRQVNLGVHTANAAALRLYQACGFEIFGTERDAACVDGVLQDEFHMVCRRPDAAA